MRKYYVSKYLWVPVVVAFSGVFIFFAALVEWIMFNGSKSISEENLLKLKQGQYAELSFDKLLMNNLGYPVCGTYGYFNGNYDRFIIDENGYYIQVEFSQTGNTVKNLKKFESGIGEKLTVSVKAVWTDMMKLDPDLVPNADDKIMCSVVFREVDKHELKKGIRNRMVLAVFTLAISFALLYTPLGIHPVQGEPKDNLEKSFAHSYNKENELTRAINRKKELVEIQGKMWIKVFLYALIAIFGFAGFMKSYITFEQTYPIYSITFMAVVFFLGLINAWKALLNTNWSHALSISKTFSVDSIPVKIENTSVIIGILRRQLKEDQEYGQNRI